MQSPVVPLGEGHQHPCSSLLPALRSCLPSAAQVAGETMGPGEREATYWLKQGESQGDWHFERSRVAVGASLVVQGRPTIRPFPKASFDPGGLDCGAGGGWREVS